MGFSVILSASRATGDSSGGLRAGLHFAGQTLVEYQARQAVRAGADHVLIAVGVITPVLSQAVDRLGADGIPVALVRDMVSMVRDVPRDRDALLIADGAIVAQAHVDAFGQMQGDALLITDDSRASAPLERIDSGQRWAGLVRVSPALLFDTLDMIGDWDLALTLVRAAVQKGARRVTVPQDDLLEGRVALVDSQQQADLVAQAVISAGTKSGHARGGVEHLLLAPLARRIAPILMRAQVPALQVRVAAIAVGAIALVPVELHWTLSGFSLLLLALLLSEAADRLDELALRSPMMNWVALVPPLMALIGLVLVGGTPLAVDLALMLAILVVANRWRRTGAARAWMILTPGTVLLLLTGAAMAGWLDAGFRVAVLVAIASFGAIILRRHG
ncbi:hypothetical protein J3E64_003151 [Sphingobium sp. OAS761]|uniref:hypothetical protein n=1 Tax=Sphingobium sp. OAS761 TaxID=2817901 RepID=UPI00209CF165|nr:hypothetical protein [Sphingobium sp. OAS761]MCP1471444.1 hypothetical protein [Sphingobium sp. OAS761]